MHSKFKENSGLLGDKMARQSQEDTGQDNEDRRLRVGITQSELGDIAKCQEEGGQEGAGVDEDVVVFVPCELPNLYAEHPSEYRSDASREDLLLTRADFQVMFACRTRRRRFSDVRYTAQQRSANCLAPHLSDGRVDRTTPFDLYSIFTVMATTKVALQMVCFSA